jgi:septal ring factor EnvC (AmiA/AmiB activator)
LGASVNNCIAIGAPGAGTFATLDNTCFIGSIFDEPVSDPGTQEAVFVDQFNVVGIQSSSRRFKHDIQPMDKASEAILVLKPVTFKYNSDVKGRTQYGLVAEEVAEVNPDLVVQKNGEVSIVRYEQVNVMLLNEFLKEHKKVEEQQASIAELKSTVAQQQKGMEVLTAQLKEQAAQIQKVSAQLEVGKPAAKVVLKDP